MERGVIVVGEGMRVNRYGNGEEKDLKINETRTVRMRGK